MRFSKLTVQSKLRLRRNKKGFTLVELMLSLSLVAMLSLSLLFIISSFTSVVTTLSYSSREASRVSDFEYYLRYIYSNVNNQTKLTLTTSTHQSGRFQVLEIKPANIYVPINGVDRLAEQLSIHSVLNKNGLINIEAEFYIDNEGEIEHKHKYILLKNLNAAEWQFYDASTREWLTEWKNKVMKPKLVKLIYRRSSDERPRLLILPL